MPTNKREYWVDNVKVIACFFVVIWHLYQSFVKSNILPWDGVFECFNQSVECFHVHLFFICSGYLYQQYAKICTIQDRRQFIIKKFLELGIPFFVFCTALWVLKTVFSGETNNEVGSIVSALFVHPLAPYWYLYCLFIIFLVTPLIKNKGMAISTCALAVLLQGIFIFAGDSITIYAINSLMKYELWFVIGMMLSYINFNRIRGNVPLGIGLGVLFVGIAVAVYVYDISFPGRDVILGLIACTAIISVVKRLDNGKQSKAMSFLSKYTMPIYLMHTLFAATGRSLLFKLGINSTALHIVAGLLLGFVGPIIAMEVLKLIKLDIFVFPTKYINLKKLTAKEK